MGHSHERPDIDNGGRSRWTRPVIGVVIGFVAISAWLWLGRPQEPADLDKPEIVDELADVPEQGIGFSNTQVKGWKNGIQQWEITTGRLIDDQEKNQIRIDAIQNVTVYQDGKPFVDVKAAEALWNKETNDLELWGEIVVYRKGEPVFKTTRLHWNAGSQELVAPERVELQAEESVVKADRLVASAKDESAKLVGNVVVEMPGGRLMQMSEALYHFQEKKLEFQAPAAIRLVLPADEQP